MNAAIETAEEEARAHSRNAGAAIAFVGVLGLVHAALFSWTGQTFFIDPPTMAAMSAFFLALAAWMALSPAPKA